MRPRNDERWLFEWFEFDGDMRGCLMPLLHQAVSLTTAKSFIPRLDEAKLAVELAEIDQMETQLPRRAGRAVFEHQYAVAHMRRGKQAAARSEAKGIHRGAG